MDVIRSRLPTAIYTADQVRTLDRIAIEEMGIAGYTLMCRAGEAAVAALRRRWPAARSVAVYCGAGNNAGDGYVVARLAGELGLCVRVIAVVPPDRLSGDAGRAWRDYRKQGGSVEPFDADRVPEEDVLVDGLLGSGLDRELRGDFLAAVTAVGAARRPVLALDVPTGLHADTGLPMGTAVRADLTVTFVGLKQGLFVGEGANFTGALEFAGLGIPPAAHARVEAPIRRIARTDVRSVLAPRRRTSHKGDAGSLLLVGGGPGMSGAVRLAAEAALRSGAGLVRVATHPDSVGPVMAGRAEVMCVAIEEASQLDPWLRAADGVVLGPGLGQSAWARTVWERVLASELPVVLDADGLNLLAADDVALGPGMNQLGWKRTVWKRVMANKRLTADGMNPPAENGGTGARWILTPHPGEASRLLGTSTREIQRNRLRAAARIAERFRGTVVLKGAGTLVAAPDSDSIGLCDRGNPGMATAGMGDVLAGILGGLLVQSGDNDAVARAGVWIHAACGDAAAEGGERGLLAGDLMAHIRRAVNPGG